MSRKIRKELLGSLLEYGYVIEKASAIILAIVLIIITIIVPDWYRAIYNYSVNPQAYGLRYLGSSILLTVLVLINAFIAYLIPYFAPMLKHRGYKTIRDKRTLTMYLMLTSVLASITILSYVLFTLQLL